MNLKASALALGLLVSGGAFAAPVQWSGNGHWYEYIGDSVSATEAFANAQAMSYNGLQGYLVTITSAEENSFVASLANGNLAWLGGSDSGNAVNQWTWRNGPENGQAFTFSNWWSGEPNNCCGGEDYVHTNWGSLGFWNDHGAPANSGQRNGFVVEYSNPVPVPAAAPLMVSGIMGLLTLARRRKTLA